MPKVGEKVTFVYHDKVRVGRIEQIELQPKNGLPNLLLAMPRMQFKRFSLVKVERIQVIPE